MHLSFPIQLLWLGIQSESKAQTLDDTDAFPFADAIAQCCAIKAEIISKDEREGSLRRILNFGHTVGHALEAQLGYGTLRHGEAVSYGMKCAGKIRP